MAKRNATRKASSKSSRKSSRKASRKSSRKGSDWNQAVMRVYKELKSKNPNTKLGEAMREASKRKKNGTL
jgi:hypothetical protein